MDTMRSLNTSLPGTSPPKQQAPEPPEQLLAAFKAAALSVTNLYKSAAAKQGRERSEGYQDALDELLSFMDKEDIGLSDGEGWRIRRWATERLDGRDSVSQNTESEDETSDKPERGSSPVLQISQNQLRLSPVPNLTRVPSPRRTDSSAPQHSASASPLSDDPIVTLVPPQGDFSFRSSHQYPQDADITLSDLNTSENQQATNPDGSSHSLNTLSRPSRPRNNNHNVRINSRNASSIGRGAGQKRKVNFGDFFDIGNLGHGKEGQGGGGKRGRFA